MLSSHHAECHVFEHFISKSSGGGCTLALTTFCPHNATHSLNHRVTTTVYIFAKQTHANND